ncbi:GlcG/HbpS family heme-binding protein [Bacillus alveayuensis]|uniref:GlcG/HbpS family heme-binding protein n=1 Tax=Aeribacillus alveayuensis TaxID=279215 RepID=UPI0005CD0717|nr:heme-binding protein [Bacillus alveayuensis]
MSVLHKKVISNELAEKMIMKAKEKAEELNIAVNIAIVDNGGHLVAFSRMDDAPILSIDISQNKAYTAIAFGIPTHEWYPLIDKSPALKTGIVHTSRLVVFGGGYPIKLDGQVIGGIGVSGGSEEEDRLCCEAALQVLNHVLQK